MMEDVEEPKSDTLEALFGADTDPAPAELPREWDPNPGKRVYYAHRQTGDYGWLVRREGKDCVKLDRPGVDEIRSFENPSDWIPKDDPKPLQPAHLAQVAFAADKQLCLILGGELRSFSKKDWLDLSQEQRRAWIEKGPKNHPDRKALYEAITKALGHLAAR